MPAATEQPAAKKEHDELLWQALKEHIMRERQKKKEGKSIASPPQMAKSELKFMEFCWFCV